MDARRGAGGELNAEAHEAFVRGARLFDRGAFFEAHEAWEERWRVETDGASRTLLQGLIQIAAGLHKLTKMRDAASAARLLVKGLSKVDRCADDASAAMVPFREAVRAFAVALGEGRTDAPAIPKLGV